MAGDEDTHSFSDRFLACLERGDVDQARSFYAPDARIWHNFDELEQTVDENLKRLASGWRLCGCRARPIPHHVGCAR